MKTLILLIILGLMQSTNATAGERNEVFSGGGLNAAKEKASKENKLLILEFTAKWCLPCRYMEKNVFQNQDVQNFSEKLAIIFQVDIDENKNLKDEYNIEVLPTIILMKASGMVLARKEESINAEAYMNWLEKNKNSDPSTEYVTTHEQNEELPVHVEIPDLDTKNFEPELLKKYTEYNSKLKDQASTQKETYFHLQTGVFTSKTNAENMVSLLALNFQEEIKIDEQRKENNSIYKVRIGNFNNKEEAVIFQQVLEKYKIKTVIRQNNRLSSE